MEDLIGIVRNLKEGADARHPEVGELIGSRIKEFEDLGKRPSRELFKELCFCVLTANFNAEKSIRIQREIGDGFLSLSESQLTERLSELGHRYPEARARYIVSARRYRDSLKGALEAFHAEGEARELLADHIKGLGYKEASHFLRNIGYCN